MEVTSTNAQRISLSKCNACCTASYAALEIVPMAIVNQIFWYNCPQCCNRICQLGGLQPLNPAELRGALCEFEDLRQGEFCCKVEAAVLKMQRQDRVQKMLVLLQHLLPRGMTSLWLQAFKQLAIY